MHPAQPVNQWFPPSRGATAARTSAHYAAHGVLSTDDVLLVPKSDVPSIAGEWSQWRSNGQGGSLQPYAQIYIENTGYRLKVWPAAPAPDAVSAYATRVYLKN